MSTSSSASSASSSASASSQTALSAKTKRRTGYVFEERYMWHDPGVISYSEWLEPGEAWENVHTKRRIHNLLNISNMIDHLVHIKARIATKEEICRFHTAEYHDRIALESKSLRGGDGGELAPFAFGGYNIACLSVGGLLRAVEEVVTGGLDNAYCLVRPPGHHAVADKGMGFCIFNNIALGALHAKTLGAGIKKIAIVDYDVHHGNGTQEAFWNDPDVLFVSLHQDSNYPLTSGKVTEIGGPDALGSTINIPLPPGSGMGAYQYAFDKVVIPALKGFLPDLILVSSGFDASYADPLGSMILCSESFSDMSAKMIEVAEECCGGRILFAHEGGYSKDYVPFCALAVIETLANTKSAVVDPFLDEVKAWGYQNLQVHQKEAVDAAASILSPYHENIRALLQAQKLESAITSEEAGIVAGIELLLKGVTDSAKRQAILSKISK